MLEENSIFTITPPDIALSANGPTITIISSDDKFISRINSIHEQLFKTVPVHIYHPDGKVNDGNLAWVLSVMRLSDSVFIDLDTADHISVLAGIMAERELYVVCKDKNNLTAKLLNSIPGEYTVFSSIDECLDAILIKANIFLKEYDDS